MFRTCLPQRVLDGLFEGQSSVQHHRLLTRNHLLIDCVIKVSYLFIKKKIVVKINNVDEVLSECNYTDCLKLCPVT